MRYSVLALAFLVSGCSSIPIPTAEQLAAAISKSSISVSKGDELLCTSVTDEDRDVEIIHTSDTWEAKRACHIATAVKGSARSFLRGQGN